MAEYRRHHDKRMAGDVFAEGSEFRDGVERRYGKEKYADLAAAGMQDPHVGSSGTKRYSGAEVRAEVREGGMDKAYYEQLKKDGAKFNGNALDFLYDEFGINWQGGGKKKPAPTSEASVEEEPINEVINEITEDETTPPEIPGGGGSFVDGMIQNIVQDNDITTDITGDNNTVENTQDNSISQTAGRSNYATRAARGLKNQYVLNLLNN